MFWWFLSDNVKEVGKEIHIYFGQGRSTHTFRDFIGTVNIINEYYDGEQTVNFIMRDESDAFSKPWKWEIKFKHGEKVTL